MPRDLALGNGRLAVNFDLEYRLRDIYYPHVGQENQTNGMLNRLGVWVEGRFSWVSREEWQIDLRYEPETLVTDVTLKNDRLALTLRCSDAVVHDRDILLRKVVVENHAERAREVRLFFATHLQMYGNWVGDTAYYDPWTHTIWHYKAKRWASERGMSEGAPAGMAQFAIGNAATDGSWGTWQDAEDGWLSGNPIAQGSVDSCLALDGNVHAQGQHTFWYWFTLADNFYAARPMDELAAKDPQKLLDGTREYWREWLKRGTRACDPLPDKIERLYHRSLLIMMSQIDNEGAILAATDSDILQFGKDTYNYCWPRDGALVARALDAAGYPEVAANFYRFCSRVVTPHGFFTHKYNPDGSPGSSWHPWFGDGEPQWPVQEDETALVVWALWTHYEQHRDDDLLKELYNPFVTRAVNWMIDYRDERGLPQPSYDLWEERRGVLAFTSAATAAALSAASEMAARFGTKKDAKRFQKAADKMRGAIEEHLYIEEWGRYVRMINFDRSGGKTVDGSIDASLCGLFLFGSFEVDDPKVEATVRAVESRLRVRTDVGGVARYENDIYHQIEHHDLERVPGNPWFITSLWLAEWYIARAETLDDLKEAEDILMWVADRALASGTLAEQANPYTDEPLSVAPLTWSHAAVVLAVNKYLAKREALKRSPLSAAKAM
jgi:glucoamylase